MVKLQFLSRKIVFVVACVLLFSLLIYIAITAVPFIKVKGVKTSNISDNSAYMDMGITQQTSTTLTLAQYFWFNQFKSINKKYKIIPLEILSDYYDKIGPDTELSVIETDRFCHDKGHNVGRAIYQKTQNLSEAIRICSTRCTTGCFHGVLMGFFSKNTSKSTDEHVQLSDVKNQVKTICDTQAQNVNITKGVCIHGVGHALEFLANYDIQKALDFCKLYGNIGEQYYCTTGVYMERNIMYGKADSQNNSSYPCDSAPYPAACFRYKLDTLFTSAQVNEAKIFCSKIPNLLQERGCFHGLGFRFFNQVSSGKLTLNDLCNTSDAQATQMCVDGAIGVLKEFSQNSAAQVCNQQTTLSAECFHAIQVGNFGLNRDFSLYTK